MSARRAVGASKGDEDATAAARGRVQDAKVALGERGEPWWEPPSDDGRQHRLEAATRTLLRYRDADQTITPGNVAWDEAGDDWRAAMHPAGADRPEV